MLTIQNLTLRTKEKTLFKGFNFAAQKGQTVWLKGKNGTGKTSLVKTIAGIGELEINSNAKIIWNEAEIQNLPAHERSKLGIFLVHQNPIEIKGLSLLELLKESCKIHWGAEYNSKLFLERLEVELKKINWSKEIIKRDLNYNLSGGEKKKSELLQMLMLRPKLLLIDEIDSGLDQTTQNLFANILF